MITTHGTTRVRVTVCNATPDEDALLADSGWRPRGTFPRTMEVTRRRADRLARCTVDVLRGVFAVADASFVDGTPAASPAPAAGGSPDSPEALQHMVDTTIAEISGHPVRKDADGDIPMPTAIPSWLRVSEDEAAVVVFCTRICSGDAVTADMLFVVADRWRVSRSPCGRGRWSRGCGSRRPTSRRRTCGRSWRGGSPSSTRGTGDL